MVWAWAAILAGLFLRSLAEDPGVKGPCAAEDCAEQGNALLQKASSHTRTTVSEDDVLNDLEGVQVIVHKESDVHKYGKGTWIITADSDSCTTEALEGLEKNTPGELKCIEHGDPNKDGLCYEICEGTKEEVEEELRTHRGLKGLKAETDVEMSAVPEKGMIERNETPSASLSQSEDAAGKWTPWGLDRVDDRDGLDESYANMEGDGSGVHVYVTDTGIRTEHIDFQGRAIPTLEILGPQMIECHGRTDCAFDRNGHGTHCAGTVGGRNYGVAKKVTLHAVKILPDSGRGGSFSWYVRALNWIAMKGKRPAVISSSLGGRGKLESVIRSISEVTAKGIPVVVAAGNDGESTLPDACHYTPAHVPDAITVGSTTKTDILSKFSNIGECVDIFAPGSGIESAGASNNFAEAILDGTSMACPHVAGAAAVILGADKTKTAADVTRILKERATTGKLSGLRGSPDKLLYTGGSANPPSGPNPTPVPFWHNPTPVPYWQTPVPTPAPVHIGMDEWIPSGRCELTDNGRCIQTSNYPSPYGLNEGCHITVGQHMPPISAEGAFSTEYGWDVLTINNIGYSGITGPHNVIPHNRIEWRSDAAGIPPAGWKICKQTQKRSHYNLVTYGHWCPGHFLKDGYYSQSCEDMCNADAHCQYYTVYNSGWCQTSAHCPQLRWSGDPNAQTFQKMNR